MTVYPPRAPDTFSGAPSSAIVLGMSRWLLCLCHSRRGFRNDCMGIRCCISHGKISRRLGAKVILPLDAKKALRIDEEDDGNSVCMMTLGKGYCRINARTHSLNVEPSGSSVSGIAFHTFSEEPCF